MRIGIFYGSTTGNTEFAARQIKGFLPEAQLIDVHFATKDDLNKFDFLIFGSSTWNFGKLQDDWEDFYNNLKDFDFTGKTVALFGLGDQIIYAEYFMGALKILYDTVVNNDGKVIGVTETIGYKSTPQKYLVDGKFPGLALDEDNESNLTHQRIEKWVTEID